MKRVKARSCPHRWWQVALREEAAPGKAHPKGHLGAPMIGVQPKGQAVVHQRGSIGPERGF